MMRSRGPGGGRRRRRASLPVAALGVLLLVAGIVPSAALAADPVFGTPTITSAFGKGIDLTQPVTLDGPMARVEALVTFADAPGPQVIEVDPPTTSGAVTLRDTIDVTGDGHILPNTPLSVRWRLTPVGDSATPVLGPEVKGVYADDRYTWKTKTGSLVRVHWYEGDDAFGQRALEIGEAAVQQTEALLGVTETEPVDFFIYADQAAFYDALGPGTRENVGGQADAEIRTLFALITPDQIDEAWVGVVVPHELVHLVFDTAVHNPYHFPPRWLDEGLAVYQSQGYRPTDRAMVEAHARAGDLTPLDGLGGQFPTTQDGFVLAYAESVSAVDYLIRTHGQDALVSLIRSYADGRTDDEAFTAALGVDLVGFSDAWLADLGAVVPTRHGPQPAPAGARPPGWSAALTPPDASPATAPAASTTGGTGGGRDDGSGVRLAALVGVMLAVVAGIAWLVFRRRRPAAPA